MDGAKGKPPAGKRQVQPISPQLRAPRPGAGRPRAAGRGSKRAHSDDDSEAPPPELPPAQPGLLPLKNARGKPDKNFKRPQARASGAAQGLPERAKPASGEPGIERLEAQVLSGQLWHKECQNRNDSLPEAVPLSFPSADAYVKTFEPLLFEEAQESLLGDWVEACEGPRTRVWAAHISSVEEQAKGWVTATVIPKSGNHYAPHQRDLQTGSILVLTSQRPPARQVQSWLQRGLAAASSVAKASTGSSSAEQRDAAHAPHSRSPSPMPAQDEEDGQLPGGLHPGAQHESDSAMPEVSAAPVPQRAAQNRYWAANGSSGPGATQQDGRGAPEALHIIAGVVWVGVQRHESVGSIVLAMHPCCPAHAAEEKGGPCCRAVDALRASAEGWWAVALSPLITQAREFHILHKLKSFPLVESILQPERLRACEASLEPEAIRRMWPREVAEKSFIDYLWSQYDYTQLGAIEAAACHLGAATVPDIPAGPETLPFLLIQGPPGTGKTHTVKGVLNVWHLVHYQRYYDSLVATLSNPEKAQESLRLALDRNLPNVAPKPRILICAPSNAAADELLQRIMSDGFHDVQGKPYRPNMVRIGSEEAPLAQRARDVWVDGLIRQYTYLHPEVHGQRMSQHIRTATQLSRTIAEVVMRLADTQDQAEVHRWASELARLHERRDKEIVEIQRYEMVQGIVHQDPSTNRFHVETELELSFVMEAEMVFTTLSSTGRRVFQRLPTNAFETVLIDEAAQASEIAALQPLTFGSMRAVLVGDPQQLPATVKSQRGKELQLERSLFERLQKGGCPVKVLSVQYRMHPEIRMFPSNYFYGGRLEDGQSVREAPDPVFYEQPLLKPYVFFDVSHGREQRGGVGGGSLRNQAEADVAAGLFLQLTAFCEAARQRGQQVPEYDVGVVTPYRQQKACLRETFERMAGPAASSKVMVEALLQVMIETVDSFQGKQLDVIILSCVRASEGKTGVGFLADIRRMNVAITRAKRALWVLGSAATLQRSPVWAALLEDARKRAKIVPDAFASRLFPDMKPFVEAPQPPHAPAPNQGQHYAELHLEDIVDLTGQPATGGATAQHPSAPLTSGAAQQVLPQDPTRRSRTPDAIAPAALSGKAQQGPPQDPRKACTPDAPAPPALSGSLQPGPPQDPRKSQMHQAPGTAGPPSTAAAGESCPADSSNDGMGLMRPMDPRLIVGAPHTQRMPQDERGLPSSAAQLTEHYGRRCLPGLDNADASVDKAPSASRLYTQLSDLDGDEALLYSSVPDLSAPAKQAKQAGEQLEDGHRPGAPEGPAPDVAEEQTLYDDPLILADADQSAAKPSRSARLIADESTAEVAIPGLDKSDPPDSALRLSMSSLSDGLRRRNWSQHPPVERQEAVPSARLDFGQTGAPVVSTDQSHLPQSASALQSHLPVGSADGEASGVGRTCVEQASQRPKSPKPITLPAPGRMSPAQRPHMMHGTAPKPITLKPPVAARQPGGSFKPHTKEYRR